MRKLVRAVLAALLVLALAAPAYASSDEPHLSQVGGARFPERSFVLTLPVERTLSPGTVTVRENGKRVSSPSVVPADSAGQNELATVLVIDASASMKGRAIKDAMAAARAFARKRNPQQQLAMVTFNRETAVTQPLTAEGSVIAGALSTSPPLADGTHLYDAIGTAVTLLGKAKVKAGSVVVLSDGADTGSELSAEEAASAAQAAGVRIYSVGLRSKAFDRGALKSLAGAGHGDYSEARSSAGLGPIYAALGSRLANEYVIGYRSLSPLGKQVHVELTAPGLVATSDYQAPAAAFHPVETAEAEKGFWASSAALVVVCVLCALLIGLAAAVLLTLRPRGPTVRQRIEGFVPVKPAEDDPAPSTKSKMLTEAEKSLDRTQWWARFKEELEIARITTPAVQILAFTALGTVFAMWILVALTGSGLGVVVALATPFVVRSVVARKAERQRRMFSEQLADNLQVISSAMRAGHSFVGALSVAVEDAPEPAQSEFRRAVSDEKIGVPLEDTLTAIATRMKSRDLEQVVLVALLQRETGGNTAEVIDRVSETIRHRAELRRTVKTLTTQGRMARWVVSALPPGLLGIISLINPEYMKPLIATSTGHVMILVAASMVIAGSLAIKRIVTIEV
jgi:tight adherence protein B